MREFFEYLVVWRSVASEPQIDAAHRSRQAFWKDCFHVISSKTTGWIPSPKIKLPYLFKTTQDDATFKVISEVI